MTAPIVMSLAVRCSPTRAFEVWTKSIATWWPLDHTVSGEANLEIFIEGHVGGRVFERTANGEEHEWGEVTVWQPPARLAYLWHLRQDRIDATEVEIRFLADGAIGTRVEIEHRGWERLGDKAPQRRAQNLGGRETLLPHFESAMEKEREVG